MRLGVAASRTLVLLSAVPAERRGAEDSPEPELHPPQAKNSVPVLDLSDDVESGDSVESSMDSLPAVKPAPAVTTPGRPKELSSRVPRAVVALKQRRGSLGADVEEDSSRASSGEIDTAQRRAGAVEALSPGASFSGLPQRVPSPSSRLSSSSALPQRVPALDLATKMDKDRCASLAFCVAAHRLWFRQYVADEILNTEGQYVADLQVIQDLVIVPLKQVCARLPATACASSSPKRGKCSSRRRSTSCLEA